ncbi:MAG: hypothetical protein QXE94_06005 [Candidatus Bathyarchaeia archaeon]
MSSLIVHPIACVSASELKVEVEQLFTITREEASRLMQYGWAFIRDVFMIDVAKYNVSVRVVEAPVAFGAPAGWLDISYEMRSAESELVVSFFFKGGRLAICSFSLHSGSHPIIEEALHNPIEWAKVFLERYWRFTEKSYIGSMLDMLSNVRMEDLGRVKASEFYPSYSPRHRDPIELTGLIKTVESVKMSIVIEPCEAYPEMNTTYIEWKYVENCVVFRQKGVGFTIGPRDIHFSDQWDIYQVGSSKLKVSTGEEAVRIAKEAIRDLTYMSDGKLIGNLTALNEPLYVYLDTDYRGNDIYTLYPYWEVYLCLAKAYPAGVGGVRVFIWADTGEVFKRELSGGYGGGGEPAPPTQETNPQTNQQAIIISITTAIILTAIATITIKMRLKHKTTTKMMWMHPYGYHLAIASRVIH